MMPFRKSIGCTVALILMTLVLKADDFTTLDGDHYPNATIKKVDPDGLMIAYPDGVVKLKFKRLPPAVGAKYGYNPAAEAEYLAAQHSNDVASYQTALKATEISSTNSDKISHNIELISSNKDHEDRLKTALWNRDFYQRKLQRSKDSIQSLSYTYRNDNEITSLQQDIKAEKIELSNANKVLSGLKSYKLTSLSNSDIQIGQSPDSPPLSLRYYSFTVVQVLPGGIIGKCFHSSYSPPPSSMASVGGSSGFAGVVGGDDNEGGPASLFFLNGAEGLAEGQEKRLPMVREGDYSFNDPHGSSRTIEQWNLVDENGNIIKNIIPPPQPHPSQQIVPADTTNPTPPQPPTPALPLDTHQKSKSFFSELKTTFQTVIQLLHRYMPSAFPSPTPTTLPTPTPRKTV